jgi:hypothetical protein
MALVLADRVQETTTTTGTGTITLAGAVSGFQSFAVIGTGNTTYYTITSGTAWEVGIGTYSTTGPTLARTTILASSTGGTAINLTGTSNVFVTYPAGTSVSTNTLMTVTSTSSTSYTETATSGDKVVILTSSTAALINVTLPSAVGNTARLTFKLSSTATFMYPLRITAAGSETIDGSATLNVPNQYTAITLISDNANWFVI